MNLVPNEPVPMRVNERKTSLKTTITATELKCFASTVSILKPSLEDYMPSIQRIYNQFQNYLDRSSYVFLQTT